MDAPPVQYVTTSDGFRIAYAVAGHGETLVYVPFPIQSLGHNNTYEDWGQNPQLSRLVANLRLVRYDTRGQGLSTRGLDESHTVEAYERDLEAVVGQLGVERVVLMGGGLASHVAVRFAANYPDRVSALVIYSTGVTLPTSPALNVDLAGRDWSLFLYSFFGVVQANETVSPEDRRRAVANMADSVNQSDWLHYARVAGQSTIQEDGPRITVPTLVMAVSGSPMIPRDGAAMVAALIPAARLVYIDESASLAATAQPVLDFLAELRATERPPTDAPRQTPPSPNHLSRREVEILRLVAAGKSSRDIGEELVLSRRTVERHIANIYLKTETHGRAQVAVYARERGLF